MTKRNKKTKGETIIYKTIDRKQKIKKHEPHKNGVNSRVPTMKVAPTQYSLSTTNVGANTNQSVNYICIALRTLL